MRGLLLAVSLGAAALPHQFAAAQQVIADRTLRPGETVAAADLRPGPDGNAAAVEALAGLEVRRAVYRGRPVRAADVGPPTLVRRNALVRLVYRSGGLGIRTEGRALDSGAKGERVRVMNLASRQTVTGVVTRAGRVEVRQ